MWWPRVAAVSLMLALAGCGFRPLYGHYSTDPHVSTEMAQIYIEPLPDRVGQLVRNALLTRFDLKDQERAPRYRLDVRVVVSESSALLERDETAARDNVGYSVTFTLYEGSTGLTKGSFSRDFSFDYLNQQYSNISARIDIDHRAAEEIATEIRNRIASYFVRADKARATAAAGQPGGPPANQ